MTAQRKEAAILKALRRYLRLAQRVVLRLRKERQVTRESQTTGYGS
jgi:hypothetical protein